MKKAIDIINRYNSIQEEEYNILKGKVQELDDCPETKVDDIPDKVKIKKMIRIEENEESYWACPECMTDEYLISIHF